MEKKTIQLPNNQSQQYVMTMTPINHEFIGIVNFSFKSGTYYHSIYVLNSSLDILLEDHQLALESTHHVLINEQHSNQLNFLFYTNNLTIGAIKIDENNNFSFSAILDTSFDHNVNKIRIYDDQLIALQNINRSFPLLGSEPRFIKISEKKLTSVEINSPGPTRFQIETIYPNPFNPTTKIQFNVTFSSHIQLSIYDILGREVIKLINSQIEPGQYEIIFEGSQLSSGIYFAQLTDGKVSQTKSMILIK